MKVILLQYNYLHNCGMKGSKGIRVRRHKVQNLIEYAESYHKQMAGPPIFFSKIQNSLKLLQGPLQEVEQPKKVRKSIDKDILSLRLTQLARHKQHPFICYKSARMKQKSDHERPLSLPKMQKSQFYTISDDYFSERPQILQNRTMKVYRSDQLQSIASHQIKGKGFERIWIDLEQKREQQKIKYQQKILEQLEQQDKQEEVPNKIKYLEPRIELKGENFAQFSQNIIKGQQSIYENYQRKLLQKVKLYRPKKIKFVHQSNWK